MPNFMPVDVNTPDRLYMIQELVSVGECQEAANRAVEIARRDAPKMSGESAKRLQPLYGKGFYGIGWMDNYVWFNEKGIGPRTMRNLAGKTIPMWIDDPTGSTRMANPKSQTRVVANGRVQVLIFRKAAAMGSTKTKQKRVGGKVIITSVAASYPGAPGRIDRRTVGGQIAKFNGGVRWRHPGLPSRGFLHYGLVQAAHEMGLPVNQVFPASEAWR